MEAVRPHPFLARLARTLLAIVFLISGVEKLGDLGSVADFIRSTTPLPFPATLAALTAGVEIVGALMLLFALKERLAALLLALFLVAVNLFVHDFWTFPDAEAGVQRLQFVKNLAIVGGLLAVYADVPVRNVVHEPHPPGDYAHRMPIQVP
jgi:putative oxidoreductase